MTLLCFCALILFHCIYVHILFSFIDIMVTLAYFITAYYEQVWDKHAYRNTYFSVCLYQMVIKHSPEKQLSSQPTLLYSNALNKKSLLEQSIICLFMYFL